MWNEILNRQFKRYVKIILVGLQNLKTPVYKNKLKIQYHRQKSLIKEHNSLSENDCKFNFLKTEYVINRSESAIRCDAWGPEVSAVYTSYWLSCATRRRRRRLAIKTSTVLTKITLGNRPRDRQIRSSKIYVTSEETRNWMSRQVVET